MVKTYIKLKLASLSRPWNVMTTIRPSVISSVVTLFNLLLIKKMWQLQHHSCLPKFFHLHNIAILFLTLQQAWTKLSSIVYTNGCVPTMNIAASQDSAFLLIGCVMVRLILHSACDIYLNIFRWMGLQRCIWRTTVITSTRWFRWWT